MWLLTEDNELLNLDHVYELSVDTYEPFKVRVNMPPGMSYVIAQPKTRQRSIELMDRIVNALSFPPDNVIYIPSFMQLLSPIPEGEQPCHSGQIISNNNPSATG